jgi:hypothetical protein
MSKFDIASDNGRHVTTSGSFKSLRKQLNKAIVVPVTLRAEDFEGSQSVLQAVLAGIERRWEDRHTETVLGQLDRARST